MITDRLDDRIWDDPLTLNGFRVLHGELFTPGTVVQMEGSKELMLVTSSSGRWVHVKRGHAGTKPEPILTNQVIHILGKADE